MFAFNFPLFCLCQVQHQAAKQQHLQMQQQNVQNRAAFNNQPTAQITAVTARTDSMTISSVPIKRARADDDDYDI